MSQKAILFDFHFRSPHSWQRQSLFMAVHERVRDRSSTASSALINTLMISLKKIGLFGSKAHIFQLCPTSLVAQSLWPLRFDFYGVVR